MTTKLNSQFYFVSPMEVVKVTAENFQEAAEWCGGKVATVESRKVKGRIDTYVWVPTPKGTAISWAFAGMFITKRLVVTLKGELKETFAVYRRDYFDKNYFETPQAAVDATWERQVREHTKRQHPASKVLQPKVEEPTVEEVVAEGLDSFDEAVASVTEVMDEVLILHHNHRSDEKCDENDCETDRYLDGQHLFTDKAVNTITGKELVDSDEEAGEPDLEERDQAFLDEQKVQIDAAVAQVDGRNIEDDAPPVEGGTADEVVEEVPALTELLEENGVDMKGKKAVKVIGGKK